VAGDVMMVVCGGESERRDEEEARGKNSACVYFVLADMFCHTNTQCYFLYIKKKLIENLVWLKPHTAST
jgi:hypothetical protein